MNLLKKLVPNSKDHTLEVPKYEGDVNNWQLVGSSDAVEIVVASPKTEMSRTEALIHAAWLVAEADQSENFEEFRSILKAVLET